MAKSTLKMQVRVDLGIVTLRTRQTIGDLTIVTETTAHKDNVVGLHKENLKLTK